MYTYLRGIWGSDELAKPVPRGESGAINNIIKNTQGQFITCDRLADQVCIFTPGATEPDHSDSSPYSGNVMLGYVTMWFINNIMPRIKVIINAHDKHAGKEYYIYVTNASIRVARQDRIYDYTVQSMAKIIPLAIACTVPFPVLCLSDNTAQETHMSYMQLYEKCGQTLDIKTRANCTRIWSYTGKVRSQGLYCTGSKNVQTEQKRLTKLSMALGKFSKIAGNEPVYIISFSHSSIRPRVHTEHLNMLAGRLIGHAQIAAYIAAEHTPADEDQIRYDDDGGCDSEDY
jgi:hypothetical protein